MEIWYIMMISRYLNGIPSCFKEYHGITFKMVSWHFWHNINTLKNKGYLLASVVQNIHGTFAVNLLVEKNLQNIKMFFTL